MPVVLLVVAMVFYRAKKLILIVFILLEMIWFLFHIHENGYLVQPLLKSFFLIKWKQEFLVFLF